MGNVPTLNVCIILFFIMRIKLNLFEWNYTLNGKSWNKGESDVGVRSTRMFLFCSRGREREQVGLYTKHHFEKYHHILCKSGICCYLFLHFMGTPTLSVSNVCINTCFRQMGATHFQPYQHGTTKYKTHGIRKCEYMLQVLCARRSLNYFFHFPYVRREKTVAPASRRKHKFVFAAN